MGLCGWRCGLSDFGLFGVSFGFTWAALWSELFLVFLGGCFWVVLEWVILGVFLFSRRFVADRG